MNEEYIEYDLGYFGFVNTTTFKEDNISPRINNSNFNHEEFRLPEAIIHISIIFNLLDELNLQLFIPI